MFHIIPQYGIVGTTNTNMKYQGSSGIINVYHPTIVGTQYSYGRINFQNVLDSLKFGWTVNVE